MPEKEKNNTLSRHKVVALLAQKFTHDYEDAIKDYGLPLRLEITEHLMSVVELITEYSQNEDESVYKKFADLEEALLKKHRKTLMPYWSKQFYHYFSFGMVLVEKNVYSTEEFNRLTNEEQRLSLGEIGDFVFRCRNILYHARTYVYLQMEPESADESTDISGLPEPDKEFTKARQLLAIYYLLKTGFNIEHRNSHPVTDVARLAHLLTGTKFTTTQNSDIYKKYSQMPDYKKGELLLDDLNFIRPFFEQLQMATAIQLIDEKIQQVIKELPSVARKKYLNKGE